MIIGSTSVYVYPSSALIDRREARRARASLLWCAPTEPCLLFFYPPLSSPLLFHPFFHLSYLILSLVYRPFFSPLFFSELYTCGAQWLVGSWMLARSLRLPRIVGKAAVFGNRRGLTSLDQELEIIGTCGIQSGQSQQRRLTITPLTSRFAPKMGRCCILANCYR